MTLAQVKQLSKRKFLIWLKNFIKDIPRENWIENRRNTDKANTHCILGHLDNHFNQKYVLDGLISKYTPIKTQFPLRPGGVDSKEYGIAAINNGQVDSPIFREINNPKDRCLKYLNLAIANRLPEVL